MLEIMGHVTALPGQHRDAASFQFRKIQRHAGSKEGRLRPVNGLVNARQVRIEIMAPPASPPSRDRDSSLAPDRNPAIPRGILFSKVMLFRASTDRTAFTLVEVMMAATILVVGFIGLIQAVTVNSEVLDTARKQQIATQIMDAEIERLRAASWSAISGLSASGTITINAAGTISGNETRFALSNYTSTNGDDNTQLSALARGFTCSYARAYLRPTGATAGTVTYLSLTYTVSWKSNTGRAYSRSTTAYFGMNGLHLSFQKS